MLVFFIVSLINSHTHTRVCVAVVQPLPGPIINHHHHTSIGMSHTDQPPAGQHPRVIAIHDCDVPGMDRGSKTSICTVAWLRQPETNLPERHAGQRSLLVGERLSRAAHQ